jgi:two-component system NtrC family sensor kinase
MSTLIPISTEEKLQERIKELDCLYKIATILLSNGSTHQMLQEILPVIKQAWRVSKEAIVELRLNDHYFLSDELPKTTVFQKVILKVGNVPSGFIKVHYSAVLYDKSYFLVDELRLLKTIALKITNFYENQQNKEQMQKMQSGLLRVDRLSILGEITAGIAHELNTPLGNILGFAELIKSRNKDLQINQDIDKVINASIFSREIVKKLMFFSCEMPYNMESIQVKPIVEQALRLLEPNFKKAGVNTDFNIQNHNLKAQIDTVQFTQVLFNLLVNAIYVAPEKSTIEIKITNTVDYFFIELSDEGNGIPISIRDRIFEPFFTTKPFGEGTGLGLSVVHGIIKSHRGEIAILKNQPKGTTFKIQLPITNLR